MNEKWGAIDVAEGIDYPRTSSGFCTGNIAFRLIIFTVVVRSMGAVLNPSRPPCVMLLSAKPVHVAKDSACPTAVCFDIQLMGR